RTGAAHCPSPRRATARDLRGQRARTSLLQQSLGRAVDVLHRIHDIASRDSGLADDLRVEPAFLPAAIDEALRKFVHHVGEGKGLAAVLVRNVAKPERDLALARR